MINTGICRRPCALPAVLLAVANLLVGGVYAADRSVQLEAPTAPAVAVTIDSENLIELYQSVPNLKIIDARHREDYTQGYIETAFNLPLARTNCESLAKLAGNRDQAMVFYCNGNAADASIAAIQIASSCGYSRLFWFRGGFIEWEDKDYPYLIE